MLMRRVSEEVVPFGAVAPAYADQTMIAMDVDNAIAMRAIVFLGEHGDAEPSLQHCVEEFRLDCVAGALGRNHVKPSAGIGSGD